MPLAHSFGLPGWACPPAAGGRLLGGDITLGFENCETAFQVGDKLRELVNNATDKETEN